MAHLLAPDDMIIVADPILSARAEKAAVIPNAEAPAAMASRAFSSANFLIIFSVFNRPGPLPWNACERCFQACCQAHTRVSPNVEWEGEVHGY